MNILLGVILLGLPACGLFYLLFASKAKKIYYTLKAYNDNEPKTIAHIIAESLLTPSTMGDWNERGCYNTCLYNKKLDSEVYVSSSKVDLSYEGKSISLTPYEQFLIRQALEDRENDLRMQEIVAEGIRKKELCVALAERFIGVYAPKEIVDDGLRSYEKPLRIEGYGNYPQ